MYLIWSIEHDAWWRPGEIGYTPHLLAAGRYSQTDAVRIVQRANFPPGICHGCMIPETAVEPSPLGAGSAISVADLEELRRDVANGSGHDCSEWAPHGSCLLCGRPDVVG